MKEVYVDPDHVRVGYFKSILDAAGIPCYIRGEHTATTDPGLPSVMFIPALTVFTDEDHARATELLAPYLAGSEAALEEWICPQCGESVPGEFGSCWKCQESREGGNAAGDSELAQIDKDCLWHPFTPMRQWCAEDHEPLVLVRGRGCMLIDSEGREYIDGNSSIWTNIHGHNHPVIHAAMRGQLENVAHTSFLGFTNPPAIRLARELLGLFPGGKLSRVFYSDDGSTAIEVAVRMALQYWRQNGCPERDTILAFDRAYHGDTLGAASLGGIALFHGFARDAGYRVVRVKDMNEARGLDAAIVPRIAAAVIEPLVQGAAGMRLWPPGMLGELDDWCRELDAFLILDEVMTGFGRTGRMFACEHEGVVPDFIALAKGLTGGCMPLAATLTTERVFEGFLGEPEEGRTFFYGHSYCGNPLGCAAALASLQVFREEKVLDLLPGKMAHFAALLDGLGRHPHVAEVRQCGMIAAVELARSRNPRQAYAREEQMGAKVCLAARRHGLLTRPILDSIVLMPPLCIGEAEITRMVRAVCLAIDEICGPD